MGKSRIRIEDDHHEKLSTLKDEYPYMSQQQLVLFTSKIGCIVLLIFGPLLWIFVRDRAVSILSSKEAQSLLRAVK
jgi:hypothetical protein